jgi:hypothetical protein
MPRSLAAVVQRCLEKKPEKRYQSAGELADDLHRLRQPSRRRALGAGAAGLAACAGLGWWAARPKREDKPPPPDPELDGYTDPDSVRDVLAKLERGESVTLIDRGRPAPAYRLALGPASGQVLTSAESRFGVQPNGYCVVELLPRLPPGEWLIEARLEHTVALSSGCVGLAAGIARTNGPDGWVVQAYALYISRAAMEQPGAAGEVTAAPIVLLAREPRRLPFPGIEALIGLPRPIPPVTDRDTPGLRRLEVSVSEKVMAGRVSGVKLPALEISRFAVERDRSLQKQPVSPGSGIPETNFLGGIGVYAKTGILHVETLTVRPKPPAP